MVTYEVGQGSFHIAEAEQGASMLSRYGIIKETRRPVKDGLVTEENRAVLQTKSGARSFYFERFKQGFQIRIPLTNSDRLFGLGDATRDRIAVRGVRAVMHVANVTAYGPMPVLFSTDGWGFVLNCTYESVFDCGKSDSSTVTITARGGEIDFFLFSGESLRDLQAKITAITGRPMLLPKFAYGLTLVQNDEADVRSVLWDIRTLRDRNIPCDTMGLEPGWMDKIYDCGNDKKWSRERFPIPTWVPQNSCGTFTFFFPMREMGMQLSLWLCEEYDLLFAEERALNAAQAEAEDFSEDAVIHDAHLTGQVRMDHDTRPDEPWFEHLKKFVDNGAAAFKLDGSNQIMNHPDRLWADKYLDAEVHNVYPVVLAKQLQNGFSDYTGRRLLLYTAGAYLGTQQYAATWAGDTGGGQRTLVSLMNYAMCGHSNTSCDIDVTNPAAIHYGFLVPWAQYFCWSSWRFPWFLRPEIEEYIRFYANLRSALIPYLYTMAHKAAVTGLPLLRPLPLMYEDDLRFDTVDNAYMLGDSLFVGAFDMHLELPQGGWIDYHTGKRYTGGTAVDYEIPAGCGGALLVKEGSLLVTMVPQKYILEKQHDYILQVFPGADCSFTLYEDDGFTDDYRRGGFAETEMTVTESTASGFTLTVFARKGGFSGRPENGHNHFENSIPKILPLPAQKDMTVEIHAAPCTVCLDGVAVDCGYDCGKTVFTLPADRQAQGDAVYTVKFTK